MKRTATLVVSSNAFLDDYFYPIQQYNGSTELWENRMLFDETHDKRPEFTPTSKSQFSPLKIGYVGGMRCSKSLQILLKTAQTQKGKVEIHLHGYFSILIPTEIRQQVMAAENVYWHGEYKHPEEVATIYHQLDLVWAGDLSDGINSTALLPNRIYEGSYLGAIPIAPATSEVGRWINKNGIGFSLNAPLQESLHQLLIELTPEVINQKKRTLLNANQDLFLEHHSDTKRIMQNIVSNKLRESTLPVAA